MEARMSYQLEPITSANTSLSDSYFTVTYSREVPIPEAELVELIQRAKRIALISFDNAIDPHYSSKQKIFDAVKDLYLSNNTRDRQIADRLINLHRDALAEDEHIDPNSISQFAEFFLSYGHIGLPKITLTPDGTLRVRWLHGPGNFIAIEFAGKPLAKVVLELPRGDETAQYFFSEPIENVIPIARAIGASFA